MASNYGTKYISGPEKKDVKNESEGESEREGENSRGPQIRD